MADLELPGTLRSLVQRTYRAVMDRTGGSKRQGQLSIIGAIATAVGNAKARDEAGSGARLLAVDAPTGVGKSMAYVIGAIPVALATGRRVVISTGTVGLQEQLVERELVAAAQAIPDMKVALVKGRSRYLCAVRAQEAAEGSGETARQADALLRAAESGAWAGDVDSLAEKPPAQIWNAVTNDRNGCAARKCASYDSCAYYRARRSAAGANVFVVNHALLLSSVRGGGSALPELADTVLVIDESHSVIDQAASALAEDHALAETSAFLIQCGVLVAAIRRQGAQGECARLAAEAMSGLESMGGQLGAVQMALSSMAEVNSVRAQTRKPVRFRGGKLPEAMANAAAGCKAAAEVASECLARLMESLQGDAGDMIAGRDRLVSQLGRAIGRVTRIESVWTMMSGDGEFAKWVEVLPDGSDVRVCASPLAVGKYLHETIWSKAAAVVHLSATLSTVGGTAPYMEESGLALTPGARAIRVDSPFDYEAQAQLVVPAGVANPKNAQEHTDWLVDNLPGMFDAAGNGNGTLVLFASLAQLRQVAERLPTEVRRDVLSQEDMTKRSLLERHGARIKAGQRSIIFGSASMEEGIDLPERLCTQVIISKLQFAVPNDPVAEELQERLAAAGRDYFSAVALPAACRRLVQSAGRLIRTRTDTGRIVVADPRLVSTSYGRALLKALPPYRLSRDLAVSI